jgi:hypothetical protein
MPSFGASSPTSGYTSPSMTTRSANDNAMPTSSGLNISMGQLQYMTCRRRHPTPRRKHHHQSPYTATSKFGPGVFNMGASGYGGVPMAYMEAIHWQFEPVFAGWTDWCLSGYDADVVDDADYSRVSCFSLLVGASADGVEERRIGLCICRICLISQCEWRSCRGTHGGFVGTL